jgi:hypothetical protein
MSDVCRDYIAAEPKLDTVESMSVNA